MSAQRHGLQRLRRLDGSRRRRHPERGSAGRGRHDRRDRTRPRGIEAEEIDATGMIVMPGFVDTPAHMADARPRRAAVLPLDRQYFAAMLGNVGDHYRPEDVLIANHAGALEALNGGVTTLLDWSHISNTPEHSDAAIRASRTPAFGRSARQHPDGNGGEQVGLQRARRRTSAGSRRRTSPPTMGC